MDQAYEVQKELINLRLKEGETLIGLKMGFTSEAKMQQMGVHDLIWGRLTSAMLIPNKRKTIGDYRAYFTEFFSSLLSLLHFQWAQPPWPFCGDVFWWERRYYQSRF